MAYGARVHRSAAFVSSSGDVTQLKRLPFMGKDISEAWLQGLLADYPEIIPSAEFSPGCSPLICIGREVPVGSGDTQGYIDNLYITPTGHLVIVETKLFRNQEARRTVIAQIVEYAKELQRWDASKLDTWAQAYFYKSEGQASRIIDKMAAAGYLTYADEAELTDNINRDLKAADFLLLIVGDGIRSNVEELAEFLNQNTNLRFQLGLVEIELYEHVGGIIAIPNILAKTEVVERIYHPGPNAPYAVIEKERSVPKSIPTRREFIQTFSDMGGFDPDLVTEFVGDMEAVAGITVGLAPTELTLRFTPRGGKSTSLLTLSFGGNEKKAAMWVVPKAIRTALEKNMILPLESKGFLDFYKDYVDPVRCKYVPYEVPEGFYFADVGKVLQHSSDFVAAAEQFISAISYEG